MRIPAMAMIMPVARGAVPSTAATPAIMVRTPVTNLIIINLLEIKGAGPVDGVTTFENVSPCFVPSRSSITRCHQNVTPPKLLIVISVDNKSPHTATAVDDLDVLSSHLVGDFLVELSDHLLVDFCQSVKTLGTSTPCGPFQIVCFDVLNQGGHFVVHNHFFLFVISHYIHSITHKIEFVNS
jgi:hypothetical protein